MKYVLFSLFLFISVMLPAQSSGKITYEEKVDLYKTLPPERQDFKEMMPQYNIMNFELIFSGDESVYQFKKTEEVTEVTSNQPGGQMSMRFNRENRVVYKNLALDTMIDSRDFMQKQFLITGPPNARKWKIGTKQKEILGYKCMEASYRIDSTTALVAWFTPQIAISNGPSDYQGLPGMILQVDMNDGHRVITATEIKFEDVDPTLIVAPTKGKEVTPEEFDKIREEKMKEMGIQHGGPPGSQQMIIYRN